MKNVNSPEHGVIIIQMDADLSKILAEFLSIPLEFGGKGFERI